MNSIYDIFENMGISRELADKAETVLEKLSDRFNSIDETAEYNQLKVLKAMQDAKVSEACLTGSTGYG